MMHKLSNKKQQEELNTEILKGIIERSGIVDRIEVVTIDASLISTESIKDGDYK